MTRRALSNPLALAVLACLYERPMYPYEITTTLRERGKDDSIRLNFGSLYSVIKSLEKHGFIAKVRAEREGNRPARQVYEILRSGRVEAERWLREILSVPAKEYPDIEAGLSLVAMLPPTEVATLLRSRIAALDTEIEERVQALDQAAAEGLPEMFTIETDYRLAMVRAERSWVAALAERLDGDQVGGQHAWAELGRLRAAGATADELDAAIARAFPEPFRPAVGGDVTP